MTDPNKTPLIIDCDPGIDDAVALLLAIASPELEILGITTVAGNVSVATTTDNARCICELAGQQQRIFAGCARPLVRSPIAAAHVHGSNGLGGVSFPPPSLPIQTQPGVDFLRDSLLQATRKITLATLGPLTNLAAALVQAPEIAQSIQQIVMMGGAVGAGNVTSAAEFNFYADPHAAQVVLNIASKTKVPVTVIPLDVTHRAIATPARRQALRALGNPVGETVAAMLENYGLREQRDMGFAGPPLHDPCVIAYLLRPQLFKTEKVASTIEINSVLTLGRLVIERQNISGSKPADLAGIHLATDIDSDGFYRLLTGALGHYATSP